MDKLIIVEKKEPNLSANLKSPFSIKGINPIELVKELDYDLSRNFISLNPSPFLLHNMTIISKD